MTDTAWQIEHSVETAANRDFAWKFMSDVANWDDPPARFSLFGPFASRTRGQTQMLGQPPQSWQLNGVIPFEAYTIEFELEGAAIFFDWRFTALSGGGTRLTQRIQLAGKNAAPYLPVVQQAFAAGLALGMSRIAAAMDRACASL